MIDGKEIKMKDGAVKSGVTHSVQVFSPELIRGTVAKPSEGLSNGKVALIPTMNQTM